MCLSFCIVNGFIDGLRDKCGREASESDKNGYTCNL